MQKIIKNRLDYKPLFWLPHDTFLQFFIYENFTIVKSKISFKKNNVSIIKKYELNNIIELNGINLVTETFQLKINETIIKNIEVKEFKKNSETLIIPLPK